MTRSTMPRPFPPFPIPAHPPPIPSHFGVAWQLKDITTLTAKINETLNPVMDQVDQALAEIDSANISLHNSNVPLYIGQVDDGQVSKW